MPRHRPEFIPFHTEPNEFRTASLALAAIAMVLLHSALAIVLTVVVGKVVYRAQ